MNLQRVFMAQLQKHMQPGYTPSQSIDHLTKIFNTALVATKVQPGVDYPKELFALVETPAFRSILGAIQELARNENIAERAAAETLIQTFRQMDALWNQYMLQEGIERLKLESRD